MTDAKPPSARRLRKRPAASRPAVRPASADVPDQPLTSGGSTMPDNQEMLSALTKIADLANALVNGGSYSDHDHGSDTDTSYGAAEALTCTPKALPKRLLVKAAQTATKINPVNAPAFGAAAAFGMDMPSDPMSIAVMTGKYFGPLPRKLTVSFMETTPADLRARILQHMNAWATRTSISFVETQGTGQVRISRGPGGYYSYLGTDIFLIPANRQTMNLQGFTMSTPESEYKRVVRHETGHTLGFPHEHMRKELVARIDPQKAYDFFQRTQGWNKQMVDQQVLTPLSDASILGTPSDQTSIMCYQLPGSITKDGKPITGGVDINATDFGFAGLIYPKIPFLSTVSAQQAMDDWDESEDVRYAAE
jgi:hypothetical protein